MKVAPRKFRCAVCGKEVAGRLPRGGDGTFFYPRKHNVNGTICTGVYSEAEWMTDKPK